MSKLYIGNLSFHVDDNALYEAFSTHGEITDHIVMKDRETGRSRGFGFVTYSTEAEAHAAVEKMNDKELGGRRLRVNIAQPKAGGGGRGGFGGGGNGGYGSSSDGYGGSSGYGGGSGYGGSGYGA